MNAVRAVAMTVVLAACSGASGEPLAAASGSPARTSLPSASLPADVPIDVEALRGRIVFSAGTNDVWSMHADGTHVRRLTNSSAMEFDPSWSPDGSLIAYRHQGGDDSTTEIYVMNADGSDPRNLTQNHVADWGPAFSPDGSEIAFNSAMGTGGFGMIGFAVAPDGEHPRRLGNHYVEYPAWSPDGARIAFMAQEPGATGTNPDYNIYVMAADGSNVRRLTSTPGEDGWPAWSPDGSRIVFASARDDCSASDLGDCRSTGDIGPWEDVWIMNADGSDQRRVTSEFGQFFAWSPDGSAILVSGAYGLFLIRPDGSGMAPLAVRDVRQPLFPDWMA